MDRAGYVIRPAAGGLIGGAAIQSPSATVWGGVALGAIVALTTHALRLRARRRLEWRLLGFGRVVLGAYGDFASGIVALLTVAAPLVGFLSAVALLGGITYANRRWGREQPAMRAPRASDA